MRELKCIANTRITITTEAIGIKDYQLHKVY